MKIIGLTGSIGMGKSETAKMFRALGVPVFDADATVHALQAEGGRAIPPIGAAFPDVITDGVLDRSSLGKLVFKDDEARKTLENIIHPMVAEERAAFFKQADKQGAKFVVLDIPLLFETGGNTACDKVVVVSAPAHIQRERVLARPGMTVDKFEDILGKQTPDKVKRDGADYVIDTSKGLDHAFEAVKKIVNELERWA